MQSLRASLLALALVCATTPTTAGDTRDDVERLAREAAERIVAALTVILTAIPQYEMPEILPNGDIIVRRKPRPSPDESEPPKADPEAPEDGPDQTNT